MQNGKQAFRAAPAVLMLSALLLAPALGGCAIMNRDNTPLLNLVEENLWPDSTGMRIVTFPLVLPTGAVAVILDAVIVHPTLIVDDAIADTGDVAWDNWEWDEKYVSECACLPWRVVFTPFVFCGSFVGRAFFDIPDHAEQERRAAEEAERDEARRAEFRAVLSSIRESNDPVARWKALMDGLESEGGDVDEREELVHAALHDPDATVRHSALSWLRHRGLDELPDRIVKDLETIAGKDADPVNRASAAELLRE